MKYKALITGNDNEMMDDFFTQMQELETVTTSDRYVDVNKHIKYFSPDIFVCCIQDQTKDDYSKIIPIKHLLSKQDILFAVVGTEEECAEFNRNTANITDLTLDKSLGADAIQEKVVALLKERKPKPKEEPAAANNEGVVPAGQVPMGQIPAGQVPMGQMPMGQMPAGQVPMGQMPMGQMPMGQMPMGQMPVAQKPAAQKPAEKPKAAEEKKAEPKQPASAPKAPPRRRRRRRPVGRGRILVIDDNPLMLKTIKEHLHEEYDVATANSGAVAFRFLERRQVDLILLDYEMPEEDGPTVLKKLRNKDSTSDVPIIFLTGISDRKKIQKALVLQPDGYLLKPIDHEKLMKTIKQYIG